MSGSHCRVSGRPYRLIVDMAVLAGESYGAVINLTEC